MWTPCNLLLIALLTCTQGWAYCSTDLTFRIGQLPVKGLLLDKGWKHMPGDNPDWASPAHNDQHWQPIDPTQDIYDLPQIWQNKIVWFPLRFDLDSSLRRESLALLIEQTGASEIFLNGRLIGKYGQIGRQAERVRAASPPFGEIISLQPDGERQQWPCALQKNIPWVGIAGRPDQELALKVLERRALTRLTQLLLFGLFYSVRQDFIESVAALQCNAATDHLSAFW